jgi:isocitrate dehydrogenase
MEIVVIPGDGIGPEIMAATLKVVKTAVPSLRTHEVIAGKTLYEKGIAAGIEASSIDLIREKKIILKAPITTPQGKGLKSMNVTLRKGLGLFANVRPCVAYAPFVKTKHPDMNVVIIRENEEDTYGGIEHRQTYEVYQCLKLITLPGTERIVRYAFEYARTNNRKKVTCFTKDNIMKMTDGLFHHMFKKVAEEYADIEAETMIVDIGAARLADTPERFDVVVMPNLYGDILSDIAAQIAGSVGLAPSSNIGEGYAMFEAIHGSAPDIAGKGIANPSGLLLAAVMMLNHLGLNEEAETIHNAWLKTIEDGIHTADIYHPEWSQVRVPTADFAEAVIHRLGMEPKQFEPVRYSKDAKPIEVKLKYSTGDLHPARQNDRKLTGVDVFVYSDERDPDAMANRLKALCDNGLELVMITNRGTKVWPNGLPETFCTDHWRCRFKARDGQVEASSIIHLLDCLTKAQVDVIKTENLYTYQDGLGYTVGQGE